MTPAFRPGNMFTIPVRVAFLIFLIQPLHAQVRPHVHAHAHNDYEHARPLFEALDNGFTSIEADVHLVNGQLMVSHNKPGSKAPTLSSLYLEPLDSLIRYRGGHLYPDFDSPVTLMIDIKTDGADTYKALRSLLAVYRSWLHTSGKPGLVQVVISGNRPIDLILGDPDPVAVIDGRPADLKKGYTSDDMPVISESYGKVIQWNGRGEPSAEDLMSLNQLVTLAHQEGKRVRLWGTPDNEKTWGVLLDAGVDLVNTDHLEALNQFLTARGK